MKLLLTMDGKIVVHRRTRNGSYERIGELATRLPLGLAKAAYHTQIEDIEREFNGKPNARQSMRLALAGLNQAIVRMEGRTSGI